jgi:hypothetical protein
MDQNLFYAFEKSNNVVRILATGSGNLRERLGQIWWGNLSSLRAAGIDMPDLQRRLEEIQEQLVPEICKVPGATPIMSDKDIQELARKIFDFCVDVNRRYFVG